MMFMKRSKERREEEKENREEDKDELMVKV
jgi:hypothetical protein